MIALLERVAQDKHSDRQVYAQRLLAAARKPAAPAIAAPQAAQAFLTTGAGLVEPLSRRELEVLGCMAEGLSNQETARALSIEVSTVKRHVNSIFGKLGAANRVQALNKAKEYRLL